MSFNVVVTDGFKKHAKGIAKKHRSLNLDYSQIIYCNVQLPAKYSRPQ